MSATRLLGLIALPLLLLPSTLSAQFASALTGQYCVQGNELQRTDGHCVLNEFLALPQIAMLHHLR